MDLEMLVHIPTDDGYVSPDYDNPTSNDAYFVYYYGEVDDNGMSGGTSYSYGNYRYSVSFQNGYSTKPSENITANQITGGFALRTTTTTATSLVRSTQVATSTTTTMCTFPTAGCASIFTINLGQVLNTGGFALRTVVIVVTLMADVMYHQSVMFTMILI